MTTIDEKTKAGLLLSKWGALNLNRDWAPWMEYDCVDSRIFAD